MPSLSENFARLRQYRERERLTRALTAAAERNRRSMPQIAHFAFDHLGVRLEIDGRYDRAELDFLLPLLAPFVRDRSLVDVGANIGNHAIAFACIAKRVVALEPVPRTFALLKFNTEPFANILALPVGASDGSAKLRAVMPLGNPGWTSISTAAAAEGDHVVELEVVRLDDLSEITAEPVGVLKVDVEGHEAEVIRGAAGTIERDRPIILLEQWAAGIDQGSSPAVDELRRLGYTNFYAVESAMGWRIPEGWPGPLRRVGRLAEAVFLGMPDESFRLAPVERLDQRDYPALIASMQPLA